MYAYAAIPLICWLCAVLAIPRKPRVGNELEELVYARLLGRQHRVALLALFVTLASFVALVKALPHAVPSSWRSPSEIARIYADAATPAGSSTCSPQRPGGTWVPDASVSAPVWDPRLVIDQRSGNG